ncbi:MAG: metallophosphoesterase [Saprospiraceae bacterium]|jgi:serine/threonine protein phosphatase 1
MARKFAIGDIHGCNKTFKKLLLEVLKLKKQDQLVLLGDYIDRGPDSLGVIQTILKLQNAGYTVHCLRGNHEQLMMDSTTNVTAYFQWLFNGGEQTMTSFNKTRFQDFPEVYIDFFNSTKHYLEMDQYILVHAGLNFKNEDLFKDQEAMLWIRKFKIDADI